MHRKEEGAKALFTDPKATEKPIRNQRICQEAPTKCVNLKQSGELRNDSLTLYFNWRIGVPSKHFRQKKVTLFPADCRDSGTGWQDSVRGGNLPEPRWTVH